MGYYQQGDYYGGGGYYQGDPGIFSFLGRAARAVVGFIPGVGPIASKAIGAVGGLIKHGNIPGKTAGSVISRATGIVRAAGSGIIKHPVLSAAAAAGAVGMMGGAAGGRMGMVPAAHQRGFHVSRRTGKVVRNRHMNVYNPRALHRAVRRAHGFAKMAMRVIHLVHPKKKARFGGFRKRRAKSRV